MSRLAELSAAIAELRRIVAGIDSDETGPESDPEGWWETSTGAEFGAGRLAELETFVAKLVRGDAPDGSRTVEQIARDAVMASTPFVAAWEFDPNGNVDADTLHDELREALGITYDEWDHSPTR